MAVDGFALLIKRVEGVWSAERLDDALLDDLDRCLAALRRHQENPTACVLAVVDEEFFVALRPGRSHDARLLLSDLTAAVDYPLARQAVDHLGEEQPDDDELDEVWPIGDLAIFEDLGLPEMELRVILDDLDLYADEMIAAIAGRVGFSGAYARVVDTPR